MTPKIFGLVLFIKILPGNKTFPIVKFYLLWFWIFASSGRNLQRYCWICLLSFIKPLFISGFKCCKIYLFKKLYLFKMIPFAFGAYLHYNHLTNAFKNSTKIWGCHVMFPHHFYAKIPSGHWRFWALHQLFQSGPVGTFALQPI